MFERARWGLSLMLMAALLMSLTAADLPAQTAGAAANDRGFEVKIDAFARAQELFNQPNLWVFETHLKRMRMVRLDVTDPKTGDTKREWIWYLVFRVVNRDLNRPTDSTDTAPLNNSDAEPPELFYPEAVLVTEDADSPGQYQHVILPQVQALIVGRERLNLRNPVELVTEIPDVVAKDAALTKDNSLYGVFIWRGIDPKTDRFTVYLTGFSNGYRVEPGPDGKPQLLRKTMVQKFWRPGDEFDQTEREIRFDSEAQWIYRAEDPDTPAVVTPSDVEPAAPAAAGNPPAGQ